MNQCKRIFLYYYSCLKVGLPVVADERKKWFVQQCIVELLGLFADHSLPACLPVKDSHCLSSVLLR